jgi:hydroxyacylglutathione hydrolase
MKFKRIKTPGIAHNAYIIGTNGMGIIIDPRRDLDDYLDYAKRNSLNIKYILQTHRQEDFVLGSQALKQLTGAIVVAGDHPLSSNADKQMKDGEYLEIEEIIIQVLHTPGHTPESVTYAVSIKDNAEKVWAVFTGDTLFIGETGRTDLPDRNKTAENAAFLYEAIHQKISPLGDDVLLYPAHGAGSVCGGNIADYDESTIGFERTYNKVFTLSKDDFVAHKMHERIPRPPYFKLIEKLNLEGGAALPPNWEYLPPLLPKQFNENAKSGLIFDTRLPEAFAGGHIPGSYSIWLEGLPVFGGWVAVDNQPIYLVLERNEDMKKALLHLARIGIDNVKAVLSGGFEAWRDAGLPIEMSGTISPQALHDSATDIAILDVREISEFEDEGHISKAAHAYVGYLPAHISDITRQFEKESSLAITCSVGHRASLATSMLSKNGFKKVFNLLGGMTAWNTLKLPIEKGASTKAPIDEASIENDFPHHQEEHHT